MWGERNIGIVSFERCCKSRALGNCSWEVNAVLIPKGVLGCFYFIQELYKCSREGPVNMVGPRRKLVSGTEGRDNVQRDLCPTFKWRPRLKGGRQLVSSAFLGDAHIITKIMQAPLGAVVFPVCIEAAGFGNLVIVPASVQTFWLRNYLPSPPPPKKG